MLLSKCTLKRLVAISICSLPMVAIATPLTIVNNTDVATTSKINGNLLCSNVILGDSGITWPHQTNVVPEKTINFACLLNKENCTAKVYMSPDCTPDTPIAIVTFSTKTGIKSTSMLDDKYVINGTGFTVSVSYK